MRTFLIAALVMAGFILAQAGVEKIAALESKTESNLEQVERAQ